MCKSWYCLVQATIQASRVWLLQLERTFLEYETKKMDPLGMCSNSNDLGTTDRSRSTKVGGGSAERLKGESRSSLVAVLLAAISLITLDFDEHIDVPYLADGGRMMLRVALT